MSQRKPHKGVLSLISLEFVTSLGAHTIKMHSFHKGQLEAKLGPQDPQASTPRNPAGSTSSPRLILLLHAACQGLAVASCPRDQPVQTPVALGQDRILPVASTALGIRVTQQLTARGPPTTPASPSPFFKDYFNLQIRKQAYF